MKEKAFQFAEPPQPGLKGEAVPCHDLIYIFTGAPWPQGWLGREWWPWGW